MDGDDFDDPFLVVKPQDSNKKMSTYLKKQGATSTSKKCVETSSHGTNSTRSTAGSAGPLETDQANRQNSNSGRAADFSSSKQSGGSADVVSDGFPSFNDAGNGGRGEVIAFSSDFGNGLEFGSGGVFGGPSAASGFGDDGFGGSSGAPEKQQQHSSSSKNDRSHRKPPSSRRAGRSSSHHSAKSNHSNYSNHSGDDVFGNVDAFASSSDHSGVVDNGFGNKDAFPPADDGFGNVDAFANSSSHTANTKTTSSSANDGFAGLDAFGDNNSGMDAFGNNSGSMDAFGNNSGSMDAFGNNSGSMDAFGNNSGSMDAFGNNSAGSGAFGSNSVGSGTHGNTSGGNGDDGFGSMDAFAHEKSDGFPLRNDREEPINFGSSEFGTDQKFSSDKKRDDAARKRDEWRKSSRSNSNSSASSNKESRGEREYRSHGQRPKRGDRPRRRASSDSLSADDKEPAHHRGSRPRGDRDRGDRDRRERDRGDREKSPPRRHRSHRQRRATMDTSSNKTSPDTPQHTPQHRSGVPRSSRRRSSMSGMVTRSDGSLEGVDAASSVPVRAKGNPRRNRSMDMGIGFDFKTATSPVPTPRPSSSRMMRRRSIDSGAGNFSDSRPPAPSALGKTEKQEEEWVRDRSRNQDKIVEMMSQNTPSRNERQSSLSDLGMDIILSTTPANEDEKEGSKSRGFGSKIFGKKGGDKFGSLKDKYDDFGGGAGGSKPKSLRQSKKLKDKADPTAKAPAYQVDGRDERSRSKKSLLERVGGADPDEPEKNRREPGDGGLSYSDRILMGSKT